MAPRRQPGTQAGLASCLEAVWSRPLALTGFRRTAAVLNGAGAHRGGAG
jgi:hypothetical protein